MRLDYSEFHPLDHRIGSRYCRTVDNFPDAPKGWGNVVRHWRLLRDYRIDSWVHTHLHCKLRRHRYVWWHRAKPEFRAELRGRFPKPDEARADPRYENWEACSYCGRPK